MPRYRFTLVYEFDNIDDVAAREQFISRDAQLLTAANTVRTAVKGGNVLLEMKCQRLYAHHEPKRLWAETVVNNAPAPLVPPAPTVGDTPDHAYDEAAS